MAIALHRFWFKFEGDDNSALGYGVTAWTEADAINILQAEVFGVKPLPPYSIISDFDVSTLDPRHITPNMENPTWRGIWFPRGARRMPTSVLRLTD
jgi:hypothetical protein